MNFSFIGGTDEGGLVRDELPVNTDFTRPLVTRDSALETIGGKGRSLARLAVAGFRVPDGFHVTTAAYRGFVADHALQDKIIERARPEVVAGAVSFERASRDVHELFAQLAISPETARQVAAAYARLDGNPAVAVRSSANAEDLPDLSFAGQQESYLNVRGMDAIAAALKNCWASLWTAEALSYRHEHGIDHGIVAMAVVVQVMVSSDVAGVLFTANPATGERRKIIVNASFGLGECVVSGQVTPDTYVLDRDNLQLTETVIGTKERMIVAGEGQGTRTQPVPEVRRLDSSVSSAVLQELARCAIEVEELFDGVPQDIEWAIAADELWLLQARAITNLPPEPPRHVTWPEIPGAQLMKRQVAENMPSPLSPLFEDLYLRAIFDSQSWPEGWQWNGRLTRNWMKNFVVTTVNGYAYQPIYHDSGKDWDKYVAEHHKQQAKLSWRANLTRALSMQEFMLADMRGGPLHLIYLIARAYRTFKKYPALVRWENQQLPDYLAAIERWQRLDPVQMTDDELFAGMVALTDAEAHYWHALRSVIGTAKLTDGGLQTFLEEHAPDDGLISGTFLSGFPSKTLDAEFAMRTIADNIREDRELYELCVVTPASRLLAALKEHHSGGPVCAAIESYLQAYGRQVFNLDFVEAPLAEEPLPFLMSLKTLVRDPGYELAARQKAVTRTRRGKFRQALAFFKGKQRIEFLRIYWTARVNYPAREAALFYMGLAWSTLRPLALELGRRLVDAGTFAAADDVFYVSRDDLMRAIDRGAQDNVDLKDKAAKQRDLRALRLRMDQPPAIPPLQNHKSKFATLRNNDENENVLQGFAVSPGSVTGVASVILTPADFAQMLPGSILVCPLTTPAWTQLFPHAVGLVTDIGSILAHGSIVAREYGIPAVLGIGDATQRIKSGQKISVDGDRGTVTILSEAP